jgi:ubiquinone/menaquinone biosynthesis C-methylase UbiE
MYGKATAIYDELYHFIDYSAQAVHLREIIRQLRPNARTLLDVACGNGRHLEKLRNDYEVEGADINPGMLEMARLKCPGVPFHQSDMAELDLGKTFDVVTCLFSSIAYAKTLPRMQEAVQRMANHVTSGGLLMVEPFFGPHNFWVNRVTSNHYDTPELKITWMYITERQDRIGRWNIHYLVGRPESVEHFTELHEVGLFTPDEYLEALTRAGVKLLALDPKGLCGRGMYIGTKG